MEIGILGPLEVHHAGTALTIGTPKVRVLLARLVLSRNEVVSPDALVDAAWSAALPANPRAALQTNVARLRRVLAGAGETGRLVTVPGGYCLRTDEAQVDADRFESLVATGHRALAAGDPGAAAARLREALRLWRGPLLDELGDLPFAATEAARLGEMRITATIDRIDADLALGRHRETIAELETLTSAHPLREDLCMRLVLALSRAGRPAEAVARCHEFERRLGVEMGLRPSAHLRELEELVLRNEEAPSASLPTQLGTRSPCAGGGESDLPAALAAHRTTPLVGRSAEHDALLAALTADEAGVHFAVIGGEPGVGKTRLAAEVAATAAAAGIAVVAGRCDPEPLSSHEPFVQLACEVIDRHGDRLRARLGSAAGELARLVPDLPRRLPGIAPPAPGPPDADRYLLVRALGDLLDVAGTDEGVLIVLDDLHWADAASLLLLRHLVLEPDRRIAVLATRRSGGHDGLDDLLAAVGRHGRLIEIELGGLSPDEISALVAGQLGAERSPWLGRSVHEQTGGNAFYALELARHLSARTLAGGVTGTAPRSIASVVDHRVDELGPGGREVLQVAALVGIEFDAGIVIEACPHADAARGLVAAQRAQLIVEVPGSPGRYAFAHGITRSVLHQGVGAGERETHHARVARALTRAFAPGPLPHGAIAHHWSRAGAAHVSDAAEHSELGAVEAISRRAHEEAGERCATGLGALASGGIIDHRRLRLLLLAAEAADANGDRSRASELAGEALAMARSLGDEAGFARAAVTGLPLLPDEAAAQVLDEALERLPTTHPDRPQLVVALARMLAGSDLPRADRLIEELRSGAGGDRQLLAQILTFDVLFGDDVAPERRIEAADAIISLAGTRPSSVALDAHTYRGTARLELGDLRGAEADFAAHARLASELHSPGALAVDDQRRAMRALLAGRTSEAEAHVHEAMLHVGDDPAWVGVYGAQLIAGAVLGGRFDDVLAMLDVLDAAEAERPVARTTRAMALARAGSAAEAQGLLSDLLVEHPRWRRDLFWTVATANLADAAAALEDLAAAEQLDAALRPRADRVAVFAMAAVCWGSVSRFLAPLSALLGRLDRAVADHERAAAVHGRLGARAFLVGDHLGLASVLDRRRGPGDEQRAGQLRAAASESAAELGMTHLLAPSVLSDAG